MEYELPVHIDDSRIILFINQDDFLVLIGALGIGMVFHQLGWFLIAGVITVWITNKYKQAVPDGHLLHLLYYYIGLKMFVKDESTIINPFAREFVG
ncbi:MAG: type IV conjugative transfer system protein TraL [Rhodanobacter sp.]